jgi:putative CocE/NonD family hydrolase
MPDGVTLAGDVVRPAGDGRHPAILNYGPYHKDGRGGRLDVDAFNRHFAARGYAALSVDIRGLGNSGGANPEPFSPLEGQDGHAIVEWIARQPWCDGNVGMWGVSYPGITSLATAATRPPHLKAIVPIHATADLYRGVVGLGGCAAGFWMRGDWGPRMLAYNLTPPLLQDAEGRWAQVWAEHLAGNVPWLSAWIDHPSFNNYWQSRVAPMERIACPTFNVCGWRDLYADCTPRDFAAIKAPKKLLMGPWKHEFPDKGKEAPCAGLWEMECWFDRWLKGTRNGIDDEAPVTLFVQGDGGGWRTEQTWPPARSQPQEWHLGSGTLSRTALRSSTAVHVYDPTIGLHSLAWDPWTTALDPTLPRDHSADDARSLCFTSEPLGEACELIGHATAMLDVTPSDLPLNLVVKLSEVAANGRSTLIATGWTDLTKLVRPGERRQVEVPLRATAYRIAPGRRLRLAVACADFPRLWPTPKPATLALHGGRISLPACTPAPVQAPQWGPLQAQALASPNDLGGDQRWALRSDLMSDTASLEAARTEHVRIDPLTVYHADHTYGAAVTGRRPDLARMSSTTKIAIERPTSRTDLVARTVTTTRATSVAVEISVDGQPFWNRSWRYGPGGESAEG